MLGPLGIAAAHVAESEPEPIAFGLLSAKRAPLQDSTVSRIASLL